VRFDTVHLYWPSWADAQLDPKTGKVWPGMAGASRQRVRFWTMLVASIDTDRPPEGPPASTQACSRLRRATGSTARQPAAAQQHGCVPTGMRHGAPGVSSGQIQHNCRLQDPSVPRAYSTPPPTGTRPTAPRSPTEHPSGEVLRSRSPPYASFAES